MPAGSNGGGGGCPGGYNADGSCIPPGYHGPPDPGTPPNGAYVSQGEGSIYVPAGADPCTISSTACAGGGPGGAPVGSGPPPPPPAIAEDVVPAAPLVATEDQFGGAILDEVSIGRPIVECGGEQQDTGNACVGPAPGNPGNWSTQELPPPDGPGAGLPELPPINVTGGAAVFTVPEPPMPSGWVPLGPTDNQIGFKYGVPGLPQTGVNILGEPTGNSGVSGIRIMPGTTQYPYGYAAYMNSAQQTVNPYTGQTVSNADPYAHIQFPAPPYVNITAPGFVP